MNKICITPDVAATFTSHVLVNIADFGENLAVGGDVLAAKGYHKEDDKSRGESYGNSGTSASTESDADVVPENGRRRGACHKPRPPKKNNQPAFISAEVRRCSQSARSCNRWLQKDLVSQTLNETKVSKAANTAISLLHTGSRTS